MQHRIQTAAAIAALVALATPAFAAEPHPAGPPATVSAPAAAPDAGAMHATPPGQANPSQPAGGTLNNPNGKPPIGRPSSTPAERGKGLGEPSPLPHASVVPSLRPVGVPAAASRRPVRGELTSIAGTVATIELPNGTIKTYTVSAKTAAQLKARVGKTVVFRVIGGLLVPVAH